MSPSVARAAIMGSVYLAALAFGRPRAILPALGLAAAVMVALSPSVMWSVSFQLSFTAMAGIALLAEPIASWLRTIFKKPPDAGASRASFLAPLADTLAMTIAATVATLPLVAFYFKQVSMVGLPATALTLLALPMVLITQAIAGVVGLMATWPALPFAWLAWGSTAYLTGVVRLFASLPGATLETGPVAPLLVWTYYGLFVLWYFKGFLRAATTRALSLISSRASKLPVAGKAVPWWVLFLAASVVALVWIAALSQPDGRLHVTFADVGQGDAILITTPAGQYIVVDGGPDPLEMVRLLGSRLPFWRRSIELVVLTHPHGDHVTGLTEVLRKYDVQHVLERQVQYDSPAYDAWRRAVEDEGAVVVQARLGQVVSADDGVFLQVINPPERLVRGTASDVDNASVVLRVVYGDVSFLLTGDIFREAEAGILVGGALVDSDVLKVAHHGAGSSSSQGFLERASPVAAVISVGEDNRFGHPHPETLEALRRYVDDDFLFLTSDRGTIEFVTDGRRLEVKTER